MRDVKAIWKAAKAAAEALAAAGLDYGNLQLGTAWTEAEVRALLSLSGGEWSETPWAASSPYRAPYVIFSASATVAGFGIHAQGSRPATAADAALGMRAAFDAKELTPDEARAALEAHAADAGEAP